MAFWAECNPGHAETGVQSDTLTHRGSAQAVPAGCKLNPVEENRTKVVAQCVRAGGAATDLTRCGLCHAVLGYQWPGLGRGGTPRWAIFLEKVASAHPEPRLKGTGVASSVLACCTESLQVEPDEPNEGKAYQGHGPRRPRPSIT